MQSPLHRTLWIGLLAALATSACREDTTDPRVRSVTFSVAPAFQSAGAAGLVTVDRIQFVLVRAVDGSAMLDTIVDILDGSEEVQVDLTVTVSSAEEVFLLTLTLFDPSGAVAFMGGPVEVTASVGDDGTPSPPIAVALVYTGVGANAVAVRIVNTETSLLFGETITLTAEALDNNGQPIPGTPIAWSSVNAQFAQVPDEAVGQATAGNARGNAQIVATLLTGPADTLDLLVRNVVIVPTSGSGQEGLVGRALADPVVVQVVDDLDQPLAALPLTFAASGGALSTTNAVTDGQGLAQTTWTMPLVEGPLSLTVTLDDLPQVTNTVPATALLPELVPVSNGQRGSPGIDVPAIVQVLGPNSTGVAGLDVLFSTTDGRISPTTVVTDTDGFALTTWSLGQNTGPQAAAVSLPAFPGVTTTLNASVFIPPPPGTDIVVFNDMNMFDETAMQDPNNQLLVRNLVGFTGSLPRSNGTLVWFDKGRSSTCFAAGECGTGANPTMESQIQSQGLTVVEVNSDTLGAANLDPALKVVFLWNPTVPFTAPEILALQQFAAEGGRIVFIGEWDGFYGATGIATENQFLLDMGAQMTNTGGAVDCGYNVLPPSSILLGHQVTTGLTGLTIACASVILPGPQDFPIMYDLSNTQVLAGVARIAPLGTPPAFSPSSTERQRAFEAEVEWIESRLRATQLDRTSASGVRP